jgi:predicted transcriptional regulator of viral defense system
MPGEVYEKLFEVATEQYGYVTTDDARDLEVDPHRLVVLASRGDLDRVAHGLYRFGAIPSTMRDQLMEATLWPRRLGTISHDTALDLWDLCDINPAKVHVSVPKAAKLRRAVPAAYRVHVRDLEPDEISHHEGIPVVTVRRAILDGIETDVGPHLIEQAIDNARTRGLLSKPDVADLIDRKASRRGDR